MSDVSRWRDSTHPERAVRTAGGQEAFDAAVGAMLDDARARGATTTTAHRPGSRQSSGSRLPGWSAR
jgi:hypothetical protein